MDIPERIREKLRKLPDDPGCYIMRDRRGRIIYVGKAASLRNRVRWYFQKATLRSADPKLRGLIKSVGDLELIVCRNEAEATLTEGQLIKDYRPRYNVSFRDDKRFLLLRVDPGQAYPRFELRRIRKADDALYFGPYASAHAVRATLDFIEKRFGLRKCSPAVPNGDTYEHCLNDIIRHCSAPCIGKTSQDDYHALFREACAFLAGKRPDVLKELRGAMEEAAGGMAFERAAALRDTLLLIEAAVKQNARIAPTAEMKREDARTGIGELKKVLGLTRVPRTIEAYDVSNISGTHSVASMVCAVDGLPRRNRYRRFRIRTVSGIDDPGMMSEVIRRRFRRAGEGDGAGSAAGGTAPDLVLVDGGITQVRAARAELKGLGLESVPVAGLAKRFEEIHWRDGTKPIRLARNSHALRVLQRLRDEAHRFALAYHRNLRSRRIRESVIDTIPGIGPNRKELLVKHFGSVRRLQRAGEEQIAEVPGIGPKMARTIKERLASARAAQATT